MLTVSDQKHVGELLEEIKYTHTKNNLRIITGFNLMKLILGRKFPESQRNHTDWSLMENALQLRWQVTANYSEKLAKTVKR